MAEELKACPFCGGEAEIERVGTARMSTIYFCTECSCRLETGETFNHGALWNRRAMPSHGGEAVDVVCITQGGCNVTWTATKELTPAGTALMSVRQHQRILAASAGSAEPVGVVLTEEQMGIGYDRRIGPVLWFGTPPPGEKLYTRPADQVADDLTMVKVSRELLQDLRDLAFDQVEHHRAAMGAYKQTRQSAMDSVLAQADALLRS